MTDALISIDGNLAEIIDDVRKTERQLGRQQRQGNRVVAEYVAGKARGKARSGTAQQRHFAEAIVASSTQNLARLRLANAYKHQANAGAFGTFYGALRWKQFQEWVGASWAYAQRGQGPYVLNDTVADEIHVIGDLYQQSYAAAFHAVFPKEG